DPLGSAFGGGQPVGDPGPGRLSGDDGVLRSAGPAAHVEGEGPAARAARDPESGRRAPASLLLVALSPDQQLAVTPRWGALALFFWLASSIPAAAQAQDLQPGDERPELPSFPSEGEGARRLRVLPEVPSFEPEPARPGDALPRIALPESGGTGALQADARVAIREIRITGNTALPDAALREIASRYENRSLGLVEIEALRDELTRAYVDRGYVTSGAVVPPQSLDEGVLELEVVEGQLEKIEVETDGRFRESYLQR